jgi:hypothetical protein
VTSLGVFAEKQGLVMQVGCHTTPRIEFVVEFKSETSTDATRWWAEVKSNKVPQLHMALSI